MNRVSSEVMQNNALRPSKETSKSKASRDVIMTHDRDFVATGGGCCDKCTVLYIHMTDNHQPTCDWKLVRIELVHDKKRDVLRGLPKNLHREKKNTRALCAALLNVVNPSQKQRRKVFPPSASIHVSMDRRRHHSELSCEFPRAVTPRLIDHLVTKKRRKKTLRG